MKSYFVKGALSAGLLAFQLSAAATDLDLYTNIGSTSATDLPNVLFIIDNTANWNTAFTNEMAALANTLHNLPPNKFNIGIMLATESGTGNGGEGGGYVRAAIRTMNDANKLKYEALVASFDKLNDKGNAGASGVSMAEAYSYFAGRAPYSGNQKVKTDYSGNVSGTAQDRAVHGLGGNALGSMSAATYQSPVIVGGCAKNYLIYISNGPNQESNSLDTVANNLLSSAAGGGAAGAAAVAQMSLSPSGSQSNPSDEWARFMKKSALGVVTYTIDVNPSSTGQGPGWTALLKSMSGLSNYTAVSSSSGSAAIATAITDALSKIQSVNSVFAAVSLPASANVQGAFLNQLYVGMFRPDPDSKPRWMGNLKQYKTGAGNDLVDADGAGAINSATGFVAECARSYWTPTATDTYWANDPKGQCIPPGADPALYAQSNTPDGNIVEKGAQAYMLRAITPAARRVKTCSTTLASCTSLLDFNSASATTAALGAADSTERDLLINWATGRNTDGELAKATTEMRPSAHGDVVHSNPLALSYDSDANVVVFYGSNDGMLHAVNGNRSGDNGSVPPGGELWAFIPPEFFGSIKRMHSNTPLVSATPVVGGTASGSPKPYAIDGPISAYRTSANLWLYTAMRRGGRALYAFDVATAASPALKWKIGCTGLLSDAECSAGASAIGQTWSSALPVKASGYFGGASPMLIMGGGYDDCEDNDQNTCTSSSKGHKIFVLDAGTGAVLTTLNTDRGVVGDVRIVPGSTGYAKYGYAADLGGNIYRINIGTAAPAAWTITKIASLGCATAASCTDNRKFMFSPSVIPEADGSYSIYIGSGDREKPLGSAYFPHTAAIANYFFKVKDKPADATWLTAEATFNCPGQSLICFNSLTSAGAVNATCGATSASGGKGWALGLRPTEQVVTPAATRFGVTTFSTHMPAVPVAGTCGSNLGTTHVYNLDIQSAAPISGTTCNDIVTGGGLPPPPEKLDICVNGDCTVRKSICIGCGTESSIQSSDNGVGAGLMGKNAKRRVYWYIQK